MGCLPKLFLFIFYCSRAYRNNEQRGNIKMITGCVPFSLRKGWIASDTEHRFSTACCILSHFPHNEEGRTLRILWICRTNPVNLQIWLLNVHQLRHVRFDLLSSGGPVVVRLVPRNRNVRIPILKFHFDLTFVRRFNTLKSGVLLYHNLEHNKLAVTPISIQAWKTIRILKGICSTGRSNFLRSILDRT